MEDQKVVFIDDVLYTGSVRAAMDAILSFVPSKMELLTLIDRRFLVIYLFNPITREDK